MLEQRAQQFDIGCVGTHEQHADRARGRFAAVLDCLRRHAVRVSSGLVRSRHLLSALTRSACITGLAKSASSQHYARPTDRSNRTNSGFTEPLL
jgi:hypothetical protein